MPSLSLKPILISDLPPNVTFEFFMQQQGDVFRALENRKTQRIRLNGHTYFIKQHFGTGWKEILKNLFQLRLPILGAKNEWEALHRLEQLGVASQKPLGYGLKGFNPATQQSFIITQELPKFITLEDFCKNWKDNPPSFELKYNLIKAVAHIACSLHTNGINHRDFYICHFLLDLIKNDIKKSPKLYLIDLHRAQIRQQTPTRWIIKDIAGLFFSSKDIGLTQRDLFRFIIFYRQSTLREVLNKEANFWQKVTNRGNKLYRKHEHGQ